MGAVYVHGCYEAQRESAQSFRWSRRWFGFVVEAPGARRLRLRVEVPRAAFRDALLLRRWPGTLSLRAALDGSSVCNWNLTPWTRELEIPLEPLAEGSPRRLAFELSHGWSSRRGDDPRHFGIRLWSLAADMDGGESTTWHAGEWLDNPPKRLWLAGQSFEIRRGREDREPQELQTANGERNQAERLASAPRVRSTPTKVYLESAWLCPLRCPSCFHAYVTPEQRRAATHFLSPVLFDRVAEQLFPGAAQVWFSGNGETLLHPCASRILGAAREFRFLPSLLTSGSCFDEESMRLLVEAGFLLTISVDSPVERDFERLRAGARFARVVAAIEHMQELARRGPETRFNLRIQCVAQESNLHQLAALVEWAAGLGIGEVQFLPLHDFGIPSPAISAAKLQHRPREANARMLEALRAGTRLGVRVRPFPPMPPLTPKEASTLAVAAEENLHRTPDAERVYAEHAMLLAEHPANTPGHRCHLAWSECFVGVDGTVTPCDMYIEKLAIGNLYDADFLDLWNGAKMRRLRGTVNGPRPEGLCRPGVCMFRPEGDPASGGAPEHGAPA